MNEYIFQPSFLISWFPGRVNCQPRQERSSEAPTPLSQSITKSMKICG
ncbi:hypothetical protein LINGRAHAP2_LOCUS14948 [Linum grandiflorum]